MMSILSTTPATGGVWVTVPMSAGEARRRIDHPNPKVEGKTFSPDETMLPFPKGEVVRWFAVRFIPLDTARSLMLDALDGCLSYRTADAFIPGTVPSSRACRCGSGVPWKECADE